MKIVEDYGAWLSQCDTPKLFVDAKPGAILRGAARDFCRSWPSQQEIQVDGVHFVQEDSPEAIGQGIAKWRQSL